MDRGYGEYYIKSASWAPMFIIITVFGPLVVILIIQPMGPILGIGTIAIFLALWVWRLISLVREIINKPRSIAFSPDGVLYSTRRSRYRIAWGDITTVIEMSVQPTPRNSPIRRLTFFSTGAPEFWFSEFMLRAREGRTPQENYEDVREVIVSHIPAEKARLI